VEINTRAMNYDHATLLAILVLAILSRVVKKNKKLSKKIYILLIVVVLLFMYLPRKIFGKWNAVSMLDGKQIERIILRPSSPGWEVNLTDSVLIITDRSQIDSIHTLLKGSYVYSAMHPSLVWETDMVFVLANKDSVVINIEKSSNDGTIINNGTNNWQKNEVGDYLEKITSYSHPYK
jgi:hypothetical protein